MSCVSNIISILRITCSWTVNLIIIFLFCVPWIYFCSIPELDWLLEKINFCFYTFSWPKGLLPRGIPKLFYIYWLFIFPQGVIDFKVGILFACNAGISNYTHWTMKYERVPMRIGPQIHVFVFVIGSYIVPKKNSFSLYPSIHNS